MLIVIVDVVIWLIQLMPHCIVMMVVTVYGLTCISPFQISTIAGELRYADAMRLLYTLEDATKGSAFVKIFILIWCPSVIWLNFKIVMQINSDHCFAFSNLVRKEGLWWMCWWGFRQLKLATDAISFFEHLIH